jgi:galactose mutarotase-like enzyme
MEKIPYLGQTLLQWKVGNSIFVALPELGARLMNWNLLLGDGTIRDVLYWPETTTLNDFEKVRGGNPILFPFTGRCFDKGDIHFWRDHEGTRRPIPIHGIARQGKFKLVHTDETGFVALFEPSEESKASYPYEYEFTVTYRFEALGLSCELKVENIGKVPLPWCPGHHFYFTMPWNDNGKRSDYNVRIQADKTLKQNAQGLLSEGPALKQDENLGEPALIDTFHTRLRSNEAVVSHKDNLGEIIVKLGTNKVPELGSTFVTWSLAPESPFYCVEPWMGPANAPENKVGLQWVEPRGVATFNVSVHIK